VEIKDLISSGLLELYSTGLASEQESAQVLQWVAQYPEVADELAQIEASMEIYSQANGIQPGSSVKAKIFAQINEPEKAKVVPITTAVTDTQAKVIPVSSSWKNAVAASVVLLLGSAILNVVLYNKNGDINKELQQSKETVSSLQEKASGMEGYLEKVQSKYSTPVSLNGQPTSPDATAKVFWMKNTGELYVDPGNLPEAPSGKQYELWAIVDNKPVNAGIIITTKTGSRYNIQKMKAFGAAQAFAVSMEPASVKPAETPTEVVAMGKM
jgi:Anti-sigma-K factor rskA